jgi:hypothetical protein
MPEPLTWSVFAPKMVPFTTNQTFRKVFPHFEANKDKACTVLAPTLPFASALGSTSVVTDARTLSTTKEAQIQSNHGTLQLNLPKRVQILRATVHCLHIPLACVWCDGLNAVIQKQSASNTSNLAKAQRIIPVSLLNITKVIINALLPTVANHAQSSNKIKLNLIVVIDERPGTKYDSSNRNKPIVSSNMLKVPSL